MHIDVIGIDGWIRHKSNRRGYRKL